MLIDWQTILRHCSSITGIIHVGAYTATERHIYGDIPTKWVEADPVLAGNLKIQGLDCYNFAATDYVGVADFNLMPFKPANSLLEPNLNKRRSDVYVEDVIEVQADMIMNIQGDENMLIMDIQGGELNALKGTNLDMIDYLLLEVHKVETYVDCPQVEDIDKYLSEYVRVETKWIERYGFGDALFCRNTLM